MGPASTAFFGGAAAAYTVAVVSHILFMYRPHYGKLACWSIRTAWFLHTLALMLTVVATGRMPAYTLFEVGLGMTWLLTFTYLLYEVSKRTQASGPFLIPTICLLVIATLALPMPPEDEGRVVSLPASLVFWHVFITLLGYICLVAASAAGAMYLMLDRQLRRKIFSPMYYRLPSLEVLDIWGHRFVAIGFPLLTLGVLTGFLFAHAAWGGDGRNIPWWPADPKVVWTVGIWFIYASRFIMRRFRGWGGRRAAWWSIVGSGGIVLNYFVIGLLSLLHRFGV